MSIPEHLRDKIQSIPEKPGIYKMKDSHGNIIYIGKSKCLSKRVKSYFQSNHEWEKIKRLVFNIKDIDIIVTDTHLEAQLLECAMIKMHMPIYNSQFTRDKNYVYLKIGEDIDDNPLSISYIRDEEYIYGPFRSKHFIEKLTVFFAKLYPIEKQGNSFEFQYHSLPANMDEDQYKRNRKCLIELFTSMDSLEIFLDVVKTKMKKASKSLYFEKASQYRDVYLSLNYLYRSNNNNISRNKEIIMSEKIDSGYKLFYISDGNLILKKRLKNIKGDDIHDFINRANILKNKRISKISEKSNMDFKSIINKELKNSYYRVVDEEFIAHEFIKGLIKL